ncbi:hypothetical protein LTR67_008116 [Exophiala xenobiotica]
MENETLLVSLTGKAHRTDEGAELWRNNPRSRRRTLLGRLCIFQFVSTIIGWALVVVLSLALLHNNVWGSDRFQQTKLFPAQLTYSPAQDEIEYRVQTFQQNLQDSLLEFQDPEMVDQAWSDLYNCENDLGASALYLSFRPQLTHYNPADGMTSISKEEATHLTNKTSPIVPGDPSRYIIQLDVFHQLHCLFQNVLRTALEPHYGLKNDSAQKIDTRYKSGHPYRESHHRLHIDAQHLNHCINSLRQSIMCHSDIAPVVWQWDHPADKVEFNRGFLSVTHTCRNFERIQKWAKTHQNLEHFDHFIRYDEDDIHIPTWP